MGPVNLNRANGAIHDASMRIEAHDPGGRSHNVQMVSCHATATAPATATTGMATATATDTGATATGLVVFDIISM